jgi:putative transposase
MIRSNCMRIDPTKKQVQDLRLLGDRVSRLYNAANYECRQSFLKNEGVPTGPELERRMGKTHEYKSLPSDIAQEVLKKLSEAWKSY